MYIFSNFFENKAGKKNLILLIAHHVVKNIFAKASIFILFRRQIQINFTKNGGSLVKM